MSNVKTKRFIAITSVSIFVLSMVAPLSEAEQKDTASSSSSPKPQIVNELYPGLTTGALAEAKVSELPKGILLKSEKFAIRDIELNEEIAKLPKELRPKFKKNAFFILEQIARSKLLQAEVTNWAAQIGKKVLKENEDEMSWEYLRSVTKKVKVTDTEIQDFYNDNTDMLQGASLAKIKPQIGQFLLQQKQQEFITGHIRSVGRRMQMTISGSWLAIQVTQVKDNPVDKARTSGKSSLVDFGSTDCVPCQMMAPILDTLKKKYKGKLNVLFVHVQEEPILASRYGVQSIPVQIFFNKSGTEVYRHVGFLPQSKIEKRLLDMGVE